MLRPKTRKLNGFQVIGLVCAITLGLFTLIGSGGGGGDAAAPAAGAAPITYTGSTAQATVDTDTKALALAGGAFGAGNTGSSLSGTGAVVVDEDEGTASFRTLSITRALEGAVSQADFSSLGGPFVGAIQTITGTVPSQCPATGGQVDWTIQYYDTDPAVATNFTGTFTFTSYCDGGITISGTATVSGVINLNTKTFNSLSFSFNSLSDGTSTLNGDIDIDYVTSAPVIDVDFDAFLKDGSGNVYWAASFVMKVTEGPFGGGDPALPDTIDVKIVSGQYYDPTHGYIDVVTTADFSFQESDTYAWPVSGALEGTGAGGTMVRLVAFAGPPKQYQVTADLDGDGDWGDIPGSYDSGLKDWSTLP